MQFLYIYILYLTFRTLEEGKQLVIKWK